MQEPAPLNIILGPTASGKESSAFIIAGRSNGSIISVDSMKIYRGLDIGTAKASPKMQKDISHYCVDIAEPSEDFSAGRFQEEADKAVAHLSAEGRQIFLSGGTALYYKAIIEGLFDAPPKDETLRQELKDFAAREGNEALYARLVEKDQQAALKLHPNDIRRVVRALEVVILTGQPISANQQQWSGFHDEGCVFSGKLRYKFRMVRLDWPREELYRRIEERVDIMLEKGLEKEARMVFDNRATYSRTPLQAVGYKEFFPYFAGEIPLNEAVEVLKKNTRHLAKSQCTWFNKFPATPATLSPGMNKQEIAETVSKSLQQAPILG